MSRVQLSLILAVGMWQLPTQLHAKAVNFEPTGNWVVNYAETQCDASRTFVSGRSSLSFIMRPSLGGEVLQIALVEKGYNAAGVEYPIKLGLSDGTEIETNELRYGVTKKAYRLVNLDAAQKAQFAGTASIRWGTKRDVRTLSLDGLQNVLAVLESCAKDLQQYWNDTEEARAGLSRQVAPEKPLASYVSDEDYPTQAMFGAEDGTTAFVLLVDEKGALKDCMVEKTSGVATLDMMSCNVFANRAKFIPALDKNGTPVRSATTSRIHWAMP